MTLRAARCGAMLATVLTLATATPGPLDAQTFRRTVTYCNRTPEALVVAVGYDRAGTSQITSQGWFGVAPCACRQILNEDLRATEIFVMAAKKGTSTPLVAGTGPMCIHPTKAFKFVGENANEAACQRAGGTWVKFKFHDTGTQSTFKINYRRQGGPQCNLD
jgi:uncharacterized membrane protein